MLNQLVVATHNPHKTDEIRQIVGAHFDVVEDLTQYPDLPVPAEDGNTFVENSKIKALSASRLLPGILVLADDSGLEVDALGGAPGVYSARFAGVDATDAMNRDKLCSDLQVSSDYPELTSARFRCVMTAARDGVTLRTFDGSCEGSIITTERGDGGFGYDPLFIPQSFDQTFAELPAETKNSLSHRSRALAGFQAWLSEESQ